jgi:hypothetical protein
MTSRRNTKLELHTNKEMRILKVIYSDCGTLNLIPHEFIGDEPVRCEKCGKVSVIRE